MKKSPLFLIVGLVLLVCLNGASFVAGLGIGRFYRTPSEAREIASPTPLTTGAVDPDAVGASEGDPTPPSGDLAVFEEAWQIVQRDYYSEDALDYQAINYAAIRGLLNGLGDPHTNFFDPPSNELKRSDYEGKFGGIGAFIGVNEKGEPFIASVIPDNPAEAAGLLDGDVILAVDGQSVQGLSQDEIVLLVRGPIDSIVTLTVRRPDDGAELDLAVTRAEIKQPTVSWEAVADTDIAHLRLTFFAGPTGNELTQALAEIEQAGLNSIILDLRGNRGGLLSAAGEVAAQFVDGEVLLYERTRDEDGEIIEEVYPMPEGFDADTRSPLVVLVDEGTASASEIVAGAVQDHERSILIGSQTYGKGSMQYVFELSDQSSLHVTAAHWLTPNRRPLNGVGLEPDVLVDEPPTDDSDPALERAVQWLEENR